MDHRRLLETFRRHFAADATHLYFSPGRINLIGDHTDYNGGHALPAAIDLGTWFAVRANGGDAINVVSESYGGMESIPLSSIGSLEARGVWLDFVAGVLAEFRTRGAAGQGLDVFIASTLPQNSGLSSSASLTVGIAVLLNDLWHCDLDAVAMVGLARDAENHYVGMQCGIMDQFAVMMGESDHCLYLHCGSLGYELVPMPKEDYEIVVTDSRVSRELSNSDYNTRRKECEAAVAALRKTHDIRFLCEVSSDDIENCEALRGMPDALKRARHVVSENDRVRHAHDALQRGDLEALGKLMYASHKSLRDDFEVSCPEMDTLVEAAMSVPGVLGSRMTGGGFGGCTVSLVATRAVPDFMSRVSDTYASATSREARIIRCRAGNGAGRVEIVGTASAAVVV